MAPGAFKDAFIPRVKRMSGRASVKENANTQKASKIIRQIVAE